MNIHTKISVIIPVYNRASLIQETLRSIQSQTYQQWECIIIDDNSTDNTWDVIIDFSNLDSRFKVYKKPCELQKGPSASRNFGLLKSEGDVVHFFDSDDLLNNTFYENIIPSFLDSDTDYVVTRIAFFDKSIDFLNKSAPIIYKDFVVNGFIGKHLFYTQNVIWKRDFLSRTNILFNENVTMCEDLDFDVRHFLISNKFTIRNDMFIFIRKHIFSLTGSQIKDDIIKRNISNLIIIKELIDLLTKNKMDNALVIKTNSRRINFLINDLLRYEYFKKDIISYWLFMDKELLKYLLIKDFLKYNKAILYNIFTLITKNTIQKIRLSKTQESHKNISKT